MWFPTPQYSVTRNITIPYFTPILWLLGIIWVGIVTLLNIAAVGYDTETLYSESYYNPQTLWYERFSLTRPFFPHSWTCTPATINSFSRITPLASFLIYSVHDKRGSFTVYSDRFRGRKTRPPDLRIVIQLWAISELYRF